MPKLTSLASGRGRGVVDAGRAGLAAACDFVREEVGVATAFELACARAAELREGLAKIPGLTLRDAPPSFGAAAEAAGARRCAIVTFDAAPAPAAAQVAAALEAKRICASVSPSFHTFDDAQWARPPWCGCRRATSRRRRR